MSEELNELGLQVGQRRVGRLMRQNGKRPARTLLSKVSRKMSRHLRALSLTGVNWARYTTRCGASMGCASYGLILGVKGPTACDCGQWWIYAG
jgi:transposase InsO family protein